MIIPIEVQTLLSTTNRDEVRVATPISIKTSKNDDASIVESIEVIAQQPPSSSSSAAAVAANSHIESNLAMQQPSLTVAAAKDATNDEKDIMLEWHRNKPSIWQQYYGSKRLKYSNVVKKIKGKFDVNTAMSYVSVLNIHLFSMLLRFVW